MVESHHPLNFKMNFHRHAFYELTFVLGGRGTYEILRDHEHIETIEVEQNNILLWDGNVPHRAKDAVGDPLRQIIFIFDEEYLIQPGIKKALEKKLTLYNPIVLKNPLYTLSIKPLMRTVLMEKWSRKPLFEEAVFGTLINILTNLLRTYSGLERAFDTNLDMRVRKAASFIHENFYTHIRLKDIASYCSLSVRRFSELFKKETGQSFLQYLHACRIDWAKKQMQETDKSITNIAFEAGYDDSGHFVKNFKKYEGITPSQYRKQVKTIQS